VVTLEQLEALDLLIWLQTTERAAAMARTDQSTISRRSRMTLQQFGLKLMRSSGGRCCDGNTELLQLQRLVHQRARLQGREPLRLQVPYWTRRMAQWRLPKGWCSNPPDPAVACEDPVGLLRDRVIDACLITSCQLPAQAEDLILFELYRRPLELTVFGSVPAPHAASAVCRQRDAGALTLELMRFLPSSCARNAASLFEALTGAAPPRRRPQSFESSASTPLSVSFLTPEMRDAQERPWRVDDALEPCLYIERLAVLAENAQTPAMQRLLNQLLPQFSSLAA